MDTTEVLRKARPFVAEAIEHADTEADARLVLAAIDEALAALAAASGEPEPTNAQITAYLAAQMAYCEKADRDIRVPSSAKEACRAGLRAANYFRAAAPSSVAPQWQPIETAPRNETVLLYCHAMTRNGYSAVYVGRKRHGRFDELIPNTVAWRCDTSGHWGEPTHWQPLPPAPGATPGGQQGSGAA